MKIAIFQVFSGFFGLLRSFFARVRVYAREKAPEGAHFQVFSPVFGFFHIFDIFGSDFEFWDGNGFFRSFQVFSELLRSFFARACAYVHTHLRAREKALSQNQKPH